MWANFIVPLILSVMCVKMVFQKLAFALQWNCKQNEINEQVIFHLPSSYCYSHINHHVCFRFFFYIRKDSILGMMYCLALKREFLSYWTASANSLMPTMSELRLAPYLFPFFLYLFLSYTFLFCADNNCLPRWWCLEALSQTTVAFPHGYFYLLIKLWSC